MGLQLGSDAQRQPQLGCGVCSDAVRLFADDLSPDYWRLFSERVVGICPSPLKFSATSRWNAAAGSTWNANAQAAIASGSKHLLAFNEPDLDSQADMMIAQSVTAWKQYMSPLVGKGAKLGSMAVTNGGAPMGIAYLQAFFAACPQCAQECDFVALHWYDAAWNTGAPCLAESSSLWSLSSRSRSA